MIGTLLKNVFRGNKRTAQPISAHTPTAPAVHNVAAGAPLRTIQGRCSHPGESDRLAAGKALEQCRFIAEAYGIHLWSDRKQLNDWKHDLSFMLANRDLSNVKLQFTALGGHVVFEFKIDFCNTVRSGRIEDTAEGIEMPLLDRSKITGSRITIKRNGNDGIYRKYLRVRWSTAQNLSKVSGSNFVSEHTKKITGGRQAGEVFVSNAERRLFKIIRTGTQGFAFAAALDSDEAIDYFASNRFGPPGWEPAVGEVIEAVPIQTPRGLQLRNITRFQNQNLSHRGTQR